MARLDLYNLERDFGKLADRLLDADGIHLGPALEKRVHTIAAEAAESGLSLRFQAGVTPEGDPGERLAEDPPKSRKNPAQRHADHPLRDWFDLENSLRAGGQDHVRVTEDHVLKVGTTVAHAGFHQDGTSKMPPRPFLGIPDDELEVIADLAADAVLEELWP